MVRESSKRGFDDGGQIRRAKVHKNLDATFTNLDSGLSATNNANQNIEMHWDANGNLTRQVFNGSPQKIHEYQGRTGSVPRVDHRLRELEARVAELAVSGEHGTARDRLVGMLLKF